MSMSVGDPARPTWQTGNVEGRVRPRKMPAEMVKEERGGKEVGRRGRRRGSHGAQREAMTLNSLF